jgi:hypothetical protein
MLSWLFFNSASSLKQVCGSNIRLQFWVLVKVATAQFQRAVQCVPEWQIGGHRDGEECCQVIILKAWAWTIVENMYGLLTRLIHPFPHFYVVFIYHWICSRPEYSWNTVHWTLSKISQSINENYIFKKILIKPTLKNSLFCMADPHY